MITLDNVTKVTTVRDKKSEILAAASLVIPSDRRIAFFAGAPRDRLEVMFLLAGVSVPSGGRILRQARLSFPVGYIGGFAMELSARQNAAHVARLYGANVREIVSFVEQVVDCGREFDQPYRNLGAPLRRNIAEVIGFTMPFDTYLLGSEPLPPTSALRERVWALFDARAQTSGMIVPTQSAQLARTYCDMGLVLLRGRLRLYEDLEEAIANAPKVDRGQDEEPLPEPPADEDLPPPP